MKGIVVVSEKMPESTERPEGCPASHMVPMAGDQWIRGIQKIRLQYRSGDNASTEIVVTPNEMMVTQVDKDAIKDELDEITCNS